MIRVLSLFSGIGAFEKAMERLGIEHEVVNYCEIDPYAGKAYSLIHNIPQEKNLLDVTKVDTSKLENIDLVTYGFPCTDFSLVGDMKGFEDENGNRTRSGLFFEALRIIQDTKPRFAVAENVKSLASKRFEREFDIVLNSLAAAGYNSYWRVLNAADYGIPQNRDRIFIVSIRRDLDDGSFVFPEKEELQIKMCDLLEASVDEKYYLQDTKGYFIKNSFKNEARGNGFRFCPHVAKSAEIAMTITTKSGSRMDDNFLVEIDSDMTKFKFDSTNPNISPGDNFENLRIRRITPKECFRLMGFDDRDVDILVENGISNTQLYKMAGNSIVVDVLERLFECLLLKKKEDPDLFSMMFEM